MNINLRFFLHITATILLPIFLFQIVFGQIEKGNLKGEISDQLGGVIDSAKVSLIDKSGKEIHTLTNSNGNFYFTGLTIGKYVLKVNKNGFAVYEKSDVEIKKDVIESITVSLKIKVEEKVDVESDSEESEISPDANKDSINLKGEALEDLPDDPEALEAFLKALAGSGAGPDGGAIFVDGFSSRNVPPKSSIREIRINRNPFSAEFDRIGYGRIEILTKTGQNQLAGSVFYRFNDESLNARNPFALFRPPFQARRYGADVADSFLSKKASYFFNIERREIDDSAIINAQIINEQFQIVPFRQTFLVPQSATYLNARTDFELNAKNTLSFRYGLNTNSKENEGVGELSLPSQAYKTFGNNQTFQLIQTSVIKQTTINEFRFQFERINQNAASESNLPSIIVSDAFVSGNSPIGTSDSVRNYWEISDNITIAPQKHTIRTGVRLRGVSFKDISTSNFNGTQIYAGGIAPVLNADNQIIVGSDNQPILENISSIERYRRTLLFRQQGLSTAETRQRGGGASQFSINGGNPKIEINQADVSGFIQDDWRLHPRFGLSLGLRFESQTNINRNFDLAPRLSFAWSPKLTKNIKMSTVIRGGFGLFYSRFGENLVLQAERFNGENLQQFIVKDSDVIDAFTNVPSVQDLVSFGQPLAIRKIAEDIRAPRTIQTAFSIEQKFPSGISLAVTFSDLKVRNMLRSRNINAPLSADLERPFTEFGEIYQYESTGRFDSKRMRINLSKLIGRSVVSLRYDLQSAKSDTDGVSSFPINQFDLSNEYGRSSLDVRHSLYLDGYLSLPFGIRILSFILANSGRPFNIILGRDLNDDSIFTERPAFASNLSRASVINTRFGAFDTDLDTNSNVIPRNYGTSKPYFTASLRISRKFNFNLLPQKKQNDNGVNSSKQTSKKKFSLDLSTQMWNLFNYTNLSHPIGNLSSPFFGKAISTAGSYGKGDPLSGSRVIEFQARISF